MGKSRMLTDLEHFKNAEAQLRNHNLILTMNKKNKNQILINGVPYKSLTDLEKKLYRQITRTPRKAKVKLSKEEINAKVGAGNLLRFEKLKSLYKNSGLYIGKLFNRLKRAKSYRTKERIRLLIKAVLTEHKTNFDEYSKHKVILRGLAGVKTKLYKHEGRTCRGKIKAIIHNTPGCKSGRVKTIKSLSTSASLLGFYNSVVGNVKPSCLNAINKASMQSACIHGLDYVQFGRNYVNDKDLALKVSEIKKKARKNVDSAALSTG